MIFDERYLWYKHTKKASKWELCLYPISNNKNGVDFDWLANQQDKNFKLFVRPSSSFGYSQAVKTWEQYKKKRK